LGPVDATFQTAALGYNPLNTDIGGPMNIGEGYRWNIKTIYYGFSPSFVNYFGTNGENAVKQALEVLNDLPARSKLKDATLAGYSTDTRRINYRAAVFGLVDLKSATLALMMEEMGLASPERYVWTLRDSRVINGETFYLVIRRNFDPFTTAASSYVNDTLYTYAIVDPIPISSGGTFADAIELPVDPLNSFSSVATAADSIYGYNFFPGSFFTGLTRDDVGGLRYLYNKSAANSYAENLVTNAIPGTGGGASWDPYTGTNTLVFTAFRPGVDKIVFKPMPMVGPNFRAFTNQNSDTYFPTNSGKLTKQNYQRDMVRPDIIFEAGDVGLNAGGNPVILSRSANFANNAALNTFTGTGPTAGPGTIDPTVVITFNNIGTFLRNQTPNFLDQENSFFGFTWGSFDGTTNDPVVYPVGMTIQDLEQVFFVP
jgi:hypothetical protein